MSSDWECRVDPVSGRLFYANRKLQVTRWEKPVFATVAVPVDHRIPLCVGVTDDCPNKSTLFCRECTAYFCDDCALKHGGFKFSSGHRVIPAEESFIKPAAQDAPISETQPVDESKSSQVESEFGSKAAASLAHHKSSLIDMPGDDEPWVPEEPTGDEVKPKPGPAVTSTNEGLAIAADVPLVRSEAMEPEKKTGEVAINIKPGKPGKQDKRGAAKDELKKRNYDVTEHKLSLPELAAMLNTDINVQEPGKSRGLSKIDAAARLAVDGPNVLTPPKGKSEWLKFAAHLFSGFMILILIAGFLSLAAYLADRDNRISLIVAVVCWVVVLFTSTMSYLQDRASSQVMAKLSASMATSTDVIRDGLRETVSPSELVVGDLVELKYGQRVPADLRIIACNGLKSEQSALTGESDAVPAQVEKFDDNPAEARNIVFASCLLVEGSGMGIVVRTADNTMIGKIAGLAGSTNDKKTTMEVELDRVVVRISILASIMATILFIIAVARHPSEWLTALVNSFIGVLIANVPEGLPLTVASQLTITAKRLKDRNVLVKRLNIIETLGSTSVICSDKTGTLTKNVMSVKHVWCDNQFTDITTSYRRKYDTAYLRDAAFKYDKTKARSQKGDVGALLRSEVAAGQALESKESFSKGLDLTRNTSFLGRLTSFVARDQSALVNQGLNQPMPDEQQRVIQATLKFINDSAWRDGPNSRFNLLTSVAGICNTANWGSGDGLDGERKVKGDASESALFRFADSQRPIETLRDDMVVLHSIPFDSKKKWAYTVAQVFKKSGVFFPSDNIELNQIGDEGQRVAMMKGAPERVVARCTHAFLNGRVVPLTRRFHREFLRANEVFAEQGERVLGFAYKVLPKTIVKDWEDDNEAPKHGLVYLGLISLIDPPREGVREAIASCVTASIKVTMVTGDQPLTAESIARMVGIITRPTVRDVAKLDIIQQLEAMNKPLPTSAELSELVKIKQSGPDAVKLSDTRVGAAVISGSQLETFTDQDWLETLSKNQVVFARTSPQQKLEIVEHYQARGEVVAVTGDGVNDSPALKTANVGVAMGIMGSEVAKEAASVVLQDDNFASIVLGIEEGRAIFDNLKKTIAYTLAHLMPELLPFTMNLVADMPLGLSAVLILLVDVGSELAPSISLAYEPPEPNVMNRPPRSTKTDHLIDGALMMYSYIFVGGANALCCLWAYFWVFRTYGVMGTELPWTSDVYWQDDAPDFVTNDGHVYNAAQQVAILATVQASWYCNLVMCQLWHIWFTRSRFQSFFYPAAGDGYAAEIEEIEATIEMHRAKRNELDERAEAIRRGVDPEMKGQSAAAVELELKNNADETRSLVEDIIVLRARIDRIQRSRARFSWTSLLSNTHVNFAVVLSIAFILLVGYVPGITDVLVTNPIPGVAWVPHLAFLAFVAVWSEYIKWVHRADPTSRKLWTRFVSW